MFRLLFQLLFHDIKTECFRLYIVVSGDLIMNGNSDSKIVLSHTEFAPWKRVVVDHTNASRTSCKMLIHVFHASQICVQLPTSAHKVTLLAYAAARRAHSSKPHRSGVRRPNNGTDRETDRRTPDSFIDPAPCTMQAVSINACQVYTSYWQPLRSYRCDTSYSSCFAVCMYVQYHFLSPFCM